MKTGVKLLHAHHQTIAQLSSHRDLKYLIKDYFQLPRTKALMPALLAKRLGQADLVLFLLRIYDTHPTQGQAAEDFIARFIGHPILIGPRCLSRYRDPHPYTKIDRTPRVVYVSETNPRNPNTDAFLRWPEYRVGRTVAQLVARGVTRRDIRKAVKHGWIKLEDAQ
jgi:hypothetical protein